MNPQSTRTRFHGYYDVKSLSSDLSLDWSPSRAFEKATLANTRMAFYRQLSYRFYPHFHPYVTKLVERLITTSVSGLQSIDTEYSTPVRLSRETTGQLPIGLAITLPQGGWVILADGTHLKLLSIVGEGKSVRLAGNRLVDTVDGSTVKLTAVTTVMLPRLTMVMRPDGAKVILSQNTVVTLPGGTPRPLLYEEFFQDQYVPAPAPPEGAPEPGVFVEKPHPVKDLDFTSSGAYSVYNWELFYHVPLTVAMHLSKNHRFAEAQRWFHYIFDPTDNSEGSTPERYWKVKEFQYTDIERIEEILVNLSTGDDEELQKETFDCIDAWKDAFFRPHVVARYRPSAYMFKVVMAYLDNLIAWGDSLFRQDTGESINEATQVYILAANLLGPRPQEVPRRGSVAPQTYNSVRAELDEFGNVMRKLETSFPFDSAPLPNQATAFEQFSIVRNIGSVLYFCVPRNDKLLSYWDTVADRLFKIRNSLNIQGIFRQLPLFEPPIDPGLLARATAAGLDISAVINGLNQPLPLVRFQLLVQKAAEICQEVKSLGSHLLSAIEKEDSESLAILRARHERVILDLAETVKHAQWQEAMKAREGLEKSLENAKGRYIYFERLLGKAESNIQLPEFKDLDKKALLQMKPVSPGEPEVVTGLRSIEVDIASDTSGEGGGRIVNSQEVEAMNAFKEAREQDSVALRPKKRSGTGLSVIPDFATKFDLYGCGRKYKFGGGSTLSKAMSFWASFHRAKAAQSTYDGQRSDRISNYITREREWAFQSVQAAGELLSILKQLRASQIREAVAERDWDNHKKQIGHAQQIEYFLTGEKNSDWRHKVDVKEAKTANKGFYTWMKREVKGLYGQCFEFAFDIAKKAERALQHEIGDPQLSFLQYGYLAGKEGLLAGEKLYLDIKRMEMAYLDLNQRQYELTKHVSLLQVDPIALVELRATGRCIFTLPETLFDMDGPGHYFRRIKTVAISIPAVIGPYSSVNCTLTLLKSSIRTSSLSAEDGYGREDDDSRFSDYYGSLQSIVTSSGQNDAGMFETNLHDERRLPFEGSGVISEWQLELPAEVRQFDYDSISDVILHMRYTAREGGESLRKPTLKHLNGQIAEGRAAGSARLFSVRHEFPNDWARFKSVELDGGEQYAELSLTLRSVHYPFWSKGNPRALKRVELFAKTAMRTVIVRNAPNEESPKDTLETDDLLNGLCVGSLHNIELPAPIGPFSLYFDDNTMRDLWLAITWCGDG